MIKSPCLDCERRFLTCHDTCEEYKEFKQARHEVKEKRNTYLDSRKWSDAGFKKFMMSRIRKWKLKKLKK